MIHKIELHTEEINGILEVLGNLPTKSGAYPLVLKIKLQVEEDLKNSDQQTAETETE